MVDKPKLENDESDENAESAEPDEHTRVADRSRRSLPAEPDEGTVVVNRRKRARDEVPEEGTVVVERGKRASDEVPEEGTVVVERGVRPDDKTIARKGKRASGASVLEGVPRGRGRRSISVPPVEPGFGRDVVEAVGPGAVSTYDARPIPAALPDATEIPLGEVATRADAPSMPSVSRRSRRLGLVAVVSFAVACLASVGGLTFIALAFFGRWP